MGNIRPESGGIPVIFRKIAFSILFPAVFLVFLCHAASAEERFPIQISTQSEGWMVRFRYLSPDLPVAKMDVLYQGKVVGTMKVVEKGKETALGFFEGKDGFSASPGMELTLCYTELPIVQGVPFSATVTGRSDLPGKGSVLLLGRGSWEGMATKDLFTLYASGKRIAELEVLSISGERCESLIRQQYDNNFKFSPGGASGESHPVSGLKAKTITLKPVQLDSSAFSRPAQVINKPIHLVNLKNEPFLEAVDFRMEPGSGVTPSEKNNSPSSSREARSYVITVTLRNKGGAAAKNAEVICKFYPPPGGFPSVSLGKKEIESLKPGETTTLTFTFSYMYRVAYTVAPAQAAPGKQQGASPTSSKSTPGLAQGATTTQSGYVTSSPAATSYPGVLLSNPYSEWSNPSRQVEESRQGIGSSSSGPAPQVSQNLSNIDLNAPSLATAPLNVPQSVTPKEFSFGAPQASSPSGQPAPGTSASHSSTSASVGKAPALESSAPPFLRQDLPPLLHPVYVLELKY